MPREYESEQFIKLILKVMLVLGSMEIYSLWFGDPRKAGHHNLVALV
jgi:hypothetical protein